MQRAWSMSQSVPTSQISDVTAIHRDSISVICLMRDKNSWDSVLCATGVREGRKLRRLLEVVGVAGRGHEWAEMTSFFSSNLGILLGMGGLRQPSALLSIVRDDLQTNEYIIVLSIISLGAMAHAFSVGFVPGRIFSSRRTALPDVIYAKQKTMIADFAIHNNTNTIF